MLKFSAKLIGWLFLLIIGFGAAVFGITMLGGIFVVFATYAIPVTIGAFIVGSVLYVLWGILFGPEH